MKEEKHLGVALKGVIMHKGRMLIIKRSDQDRFRPGTWECAGGKMDFGEGLEECLKREVIEETGLDVNVERLLYAMTFFPYPTRQAVVLTYLCSTEDAKVKLSQEHSDYLWADQAQIRQLIDPHILQDFTANHVFEAIGMA